MSYLLDTCVVSEFGRPRPDPGVVQWLGQQKPDALYLSEVTVAELSAGLVKLRIKDPGRAQKLDVWLSGVLLRFAGNTLGTDESVWHVWAELSGTADAAGTTVAPLDGLLIATAQRYGLTVVTRNVSDFAIYPQVFNPWQDKLPR